MAWTIKIGQILKPGMTKIKIDYTLLQDGYFYNNGEAIFDISELDGKDSKAIEKQVKDLLIEKCLVMAKVDEIAKGLEALKDTEVVVK